MTDFWAVSTFWIVALLFLAVALAFVLPPLLRRDPGGSPDDPVVARAALQRSQLAELDADLRAGTLALEHYDEARGELRDAAPAAVAPAAGATGRGRWAAFALAGVVPVAAITAYLALGSPSHLLPGAVPAPVAAGGQHDPEAMVAALVEKLQQHPDDGAGWAMLGRSYVALGRSQEGAQAFARAAALTPGDAALLADYAEAVALAQNGSMAGVPANLVARALAIDPNEQKALMLAGVVANQGGDFAQAVSYWRRLLAMIPSDGDLARQLAAAIATAQAATAPGSAARTAAPAAAGGSISGTLTLSPQLAGKASPGDTVFIFAQAPQGPPMPLAVQRLTAGQLPYRFTLDDSMSMANGDRLSAHPQVTITARVSKSGQPMPQSGDLQGRVGPVPMGRSGVALTIDTVVP